MAGKKSKKLKKNSLEKSRKKKAKKDKIIEGKGQKIIKKWIKKSRIKI